MTQDILSSPIIKSAIKDIASRAKADALKLGNAHILLTGGTGFFGSWVLVSFAALRELGLPLEMTVLSRAPDQFLAKNPSFQNMPGLSFRKGDVTDATIPFSITHILHFATSGAKADTLDQEQEIRRTVVEGTRHMLVEAKRVGAARFLMASSAAVYGQAPVQTSGKSEIGPLTESTIIQDAKFTAYGEAKREAEALCRSASAARDIETVVARGFTFSGPLFPISGPYVISSFMTSILNGLPLQLRTPQAQRSFMDGRDLVVALWKLLANGRDGEAYNLGSEEMVSMSELADIMRSVALKVSLRVPEVKIVAPPMTQGLSPGSDCIRPSMAKLRTELGFQPMITLRESLRAQAQWALESVDKS